jgi:hypothetical protein|nr:MAG TPA: hypothetical protein [Caudoviricetes sp.]
MVLIENPTFSELDEAYRRYFTLGYLNTDIGSKFALISLTCFLTKQARVKTPEATPYDVLLKVIGGDTSSFDMEFLRAVAAICNDFMRNTTEFLTFDMKSSREMVIKIREILSTYLPF